MRHTRNLNSYDLWVVSQNTPTFGNEDDQETYTEELTFLAHDPIFYDSESTSTLLSSAVPSELSIPFSIGASLGMIFDAGGGVAQGTINYQCSWPAYPVITVTGGYDKIYIHNLTTGAQVALGQAITSGQSRIIDLNPNKPTVIDQDGNDKFIELEVPQSNLLAFNLRPDGQAWRDNHLMSVSNGENIISATALNASGATVTIEYKNAWISLGG